MKRIYGMRPGLYRLHWDGGGTGLAAVGCLTNGANWFAPTNWTSEWPGGVASEAWELVEHAEPLDPDDWYAAEVERMKERAPA